MLQPPQTYNHVYMKAMGIVNISDFMKAEGKGVIYEHW